MKSIFISESEREVRRVYAPETIGWLVEQAGLENVVYNKESIVNAPEKWSDVRFVFSTWGMPSFTEEEIDRCFPNLEAVFYGAGSVQSFARPFLNKGVKVFSAWAANGVPVAEYTVAQIILANKGFFRSSRFEHAEERENARKCHVTYPGNYGVKVGIIGAGMIGKMVIERLKAYDLQVMVFDPFLPDDKAKGLGVEKTTLEQVFANCQVVSNHLANNAQTKGMLNYPLFASMPTNGTFLNTGRGAQVVEEDLVRVLEERPDLTAILDVTYPEPPVDGHAFYRLGNCILTPHIAGSSGQEVQRMSVYMVEEFKRYRENQPCLYEVNHKMLETMA